MDTEAQIILKANCPKRDKQVDVEKQLRKPKQKRPFGYRFGARGRLNKHKSL